MATGLWFRPSAAKGGHLAFGIGSACHYPMIIIPEMFNKTRITFDKIIRLIISSILKRKIGGVEYGVAIISEGVFHFLTNTEIESTGINFTFDEHGHPELGNVSKAHIFNMLLQRKLKEIGLDAKSRPVEIGYEIRCSRPIAFDLMYCGLLGMGVKRLFDQGVTAAMVMVDNLGDVSPLYLKDVQGKDGKVKPRLLNMDSQKVRTVYDHGLQYIGEEDYDEAAKFVENPESFDFRKILEW